ncbi:DUF456 domain-containing protein [Solimonas terrae]|uniref:DUF456 domain-containing protein n=1 Tax=Solimonas terrae TaxID=1396819 RepID=A0A6M2BR25_9GAMM|nr:DUF456 family protein [Solimonas terrae]NGY04938.1 DUF456 domain-containing protein [Solimonas terrae]
MNSLWPVLSTLIAIALIVAGLLGTLLPIIPGAPLVFFGLWLIALTDHYRHVGWPTLTLLGAVVIVTVIVDFVASALGAKKVGASPQAVTGALLGSIVGAFLGIPGLLLGPFVGAVVGELVAQRRVERAATVGLATWLGLLAGSIAKLALCLTMLLIFAFAWWL